MALLNIFKKTQDQNPNGSQTIPPVKPVKYAKAIAVQNGTISVQQNSAAVNTILAGK